MFGLWRWLDLMYESRKGPTGSAWLAAEGSLHVLVPLFPNSETWLKLPLTFEEDGRSRKGIVSVCPYAFGEKSFYSIDSGDG